MADFHFIKADPSSGLLNIPNAEKYHLAQWLGNDAPTIEDLKNTSNWKGLMVQLPIQTFDIYGRILSNGKTSEFTHQIVQGLAEDAYPNAEETPNGLKYYFRIVGKMTVKLRETTQKTDVKFSGKFYTKVYNQVDAHEIKLLTDLTNVGFGDPNNNGYESIYLTVKDICPDEFGNAEWEHYVEIYKLPEGHEVDYAEIKEEDITLCGCEKEYHRTTYIPLDCLTDSPLLDNGCVGMFNYSDANQEETAKISCYDKDLKRLGCILGNELPKNTYVTAQGVKDFVHNVYSQTEYVIFSSRIDNNNSYEDKVSIGNICFQLFNLFDMDFDKTYSPIRVSVKAEGDGLFYIDSIYSDAVGYPRVFEE